MAMDNFLEEVATKRNRGAETVMYVLANIMMVVFGLWAFLMLQGIMMLINAGEGAGPIIYYVVMTLLTGGIAVLLFLRCRGHAVTVTHRSGACQTPLTVFCRTVQRLLLCFMIDKS